jgi:uncharacterized protein (TIGR02646 family)
MIKVTRLPQPPILQQRADEWTNELCEARQEYYRGLREFESGDSTSKPKYPRAQRTRYAHQQVRERLQEMFGPKCAYCESRVTAVSYQHVEHFRPQSIYPCLAYKWDNLLLVCGVCNSGYKKEKFPLMDGSQPEEDRQHPCSLDDADDNALVNPCRDDPEDFFDFDDEWLVCRNARARYTRDVCALNREALKDSRRFYLVLIEAIAKLFLAFQGDEEHKRQSASVLRDCLDPSAPYTAMVRAKLVALGINVEEALNS